MSWYKQTELNTPAPAGEPTIQQVLSLLNLCLFTSGGGLFLFVELDIPPTRPEFVLPLTAAEAAALAALNVPTCIVSSTIPQVGLGAAVELRGVFTIGTQSFAVFRTFVTGTGATIQKVLVPTATIPVVLRAAAPVAAPA